MVGTGTRAHPHRHRLIHHGLPTRTSTGASPVVVFKSCMLTIGNAVVWVRGSWKQQQRADIRRRQVGAADLLTRTGSLLKRIWAVDKSKRLRYVGGGRQKTESGPRHRAPTTSIYGQQNSEAQLETYRFKKTLHLRYSNTIPSVGQNKGPKSRKCRKVLCNSQYRDGVVPVRNQDFQ